jgi:hypothetical protein
MQGGFRIFILHNAALSTSLLEAKAYHNFFVSNFLE